MLASFAFWEVKSQPKTSQYHKGWPSKEGETNIRASFANPPKGYGNVPFYPKTLTRIEYNPYRNATTVARLVLRFLRTRRFAGTVVESVKYIRGETF